MKAIINVIKTSCGDSVNLLGWGSDETQARIVAFASTNHGHNSFDNLYAGGTVVEFSTKLSAMSVAADISAEMIEDNAGVSMGITDDDFDFQQALCRLYVEDGILKSKSCDLEAA